MLPVAVLAGGLGTRLRAVTGADAPKALAPVAGRPFIDHKLLELRAEGASDVLLLVGHGAGEIRAHVRGGEAFGLRVDYLEDGPTLLGTGGAIARAIPRLGDRFWVTYGDTLLEVDVAGAERQLRNDGTAALMTVLHNRDRWEPSNVLVRGGRVAAYGKAPRPEGAEHIDYGMLLFTAAPFEARVAEGAFDLALVIGDLVAEDEVAAFPVTERFHDIGTPQALLDTEAWLRLRAEDN